MHHPIISGILLGAAVLLAILCSIGVLVMRDAYQRLHFPTPVVSFSAAFIAAAVWIEETDVQARIKVTLIMIILFVMNAILSHATAKAIRIRHAGHWEPRPEDRIPIIGRDRVAGSADAPEEHRS